MGLFEWISTDSFACSQGISALHDMEIIHCDLKPSNVLLKGNRGDWRGFMAAVCDFGLSRRGCSVA